MANQANLATFTSNMYSNAPMDVVRISLLIQVQNSQC